MFIKIIYISGSTFKLVELGSKEAIYHKGKYAILGLKVESDFWISSQFIHSCQYLKLQAYVRSNIEFKRIGLRVYGQVITP